MTAQTSTHQPVRLGLTTLTTLVVGSMVGAGVFSLPAEFAGATGVVGTLVVWALAGSGMLMLALVLQRLAVRRPDLDSGIYAYATAGFGELMGFFSAFGYWLSACAGNAFYWILIMSTAGAVVPGLGQGDTVLAVAVASVLLWTFFLLVRRGVREATAINRVVTVAKTLPILVFVVLALTAFDAEVFAANLRAGGTPGAGLFEQVRATLLVTVFVFLGVEGASVYSRHARRRSDVGRATVLGFASVLAVFASVTIVSFGVLPAADVAALRQPSMAGVLEAAVGSWGAVLVSVGLVVSVLGAYLAWTLMSAEVLLVAARHGDMPRFLARTNASDAPGNALLLTSVTAQGLLLVTLLSEDAFDFALELTAALTLVPYVLAAGYGLRLARADSAGHPGRAGRDGDDRGGGTVAVGRGPVVVAALAVAYTVFLVVAAGLPYLLLAAVVYAPATLLLARARREQGRTAFSRAELVMVGLVALAAVACVVALTTGALTF